MKLIKKIWEAILSSFEAVSKVFDENFNTSSDVMSRDTRKILANKHDRKRYAEAIRRLKSKESEEEIFEWGNGKKMLLVLRKGPTIIN